MPLDNLRPLFVHSNGLVRRSAAYIASELGHRAKPLIADVAPLIRDPDPHSRWYAVESVMVCSTGSETDWFLLVVRELDSDDQWMRQLAMRLISNADSSQLETGSALSRTLGPSAFQHAQGLSFLLEVESVDASAITARLGSPAPLTRKYGAIAARRLRKTSSKLLASAVLNPDPDISRFAEKELRRLAKRSKS